MKMPIHLLCFIPKQFQCLGNDLKLPQLDWVEGTGVWIWILVWLYETLMEEDVTKTENNNNIIKEQVPRNWMSEIFWRVLSRKPPTEKHSLKSLPRRVTLKTWMCAEQVFQQLLPTASFKSGENFSNYSEIFKNNVLNCELEERQHIQRGKNKYQLSKINRLYMYIYI